MQIYISRDGEKKGPYSIEDVNSYLKDGTLLPSDMACQEGMDEWVPVSQIPGVGMPESSATPSISSSQSVSKPAPSPEPGKEVQGSDELEERKDAARRQPVKHTALRLVVGLPVLSLGLFIVTVIVIGPSDFPEFGLFVYAIMLVLLSSIWAGYDSSKIEFEKYKSTISDRPFMIIIGCLALWIVIFPWYLFQRDKIINGLAELKERSSLPPSRHGDDLGSGNGGHHSQSAFTEVPTSWMWSKLIILILWLISGVIVLGIVIGIHKEIGLYYDSRIIDEAKADGRFFGSKDLRIINAVYRTRGKWNKWIPDWYVVGFTVVLYSVGSGGVYYYRTKNPTKKAEIIG